LDATDQEHVDGTMIELDRTANKSRWAPNAILAVSLAWRKQPRNPAGCLCFAISAGLRPVLPSPMMNILSGGNTRTTTSISRNS
jgi:enolase